MTVNDNGEFRKQVQVASVLTEGDEAVILFGLLNKAPRFLSMNLDSKFLVQLSMTQRLPAVGA